MTMIFLKIESVQLDPSHKLVVWINEGFRHFYVASITSLVYCLIHLVINEYVPERKKATNLSLRLHSLSMMLTLSFALWLFIDGLNAILWISKSGVIRQFIWFFMACVAMVASGCVFVARFYNEINYMGEKRFSKIVWNEVYKNCKFFFSKLFLSPFNDFLIVKFF